MTLWSTILNKNALKYLLLRLSYWQNPTDRLIV